MRTTEIELPAIGEPETLRPRERELPAPGPGQALVRVDPRRNAITRKVPISRAGFNALDAVSDGRILYVQRADRRLLAGADAALAPRLPLLLDGDGAMLEASRGNLFVVHDGELVTPPTDGRILPATWSWDNYSAIFDADSPFLPALRNSFGIAIIAIALLIMVGAVARFGRR